MDACGLYGADRTTIKGLDKRLTYPRVPGHEIVRRIRAKGRAVSSGWFLGQRLGMGRLVGHCLSSMSCRQEYFNLCEDQPTVGATFDGGSADCVLVRATALVPIPESLASVYAAPILCAGNSCCLRAYHRTVKARKSSVAWCGTRTIAYQSGLTGFWRASSARRNDRYAAPVGATARLQRAHKHSTGDSNLALGSSRVGLRTTAQRSDWLPCCAYEY